MLFGDLRPNGVSSYIEGNRNQILGNPSFLDSFCTRANLALKTNWQRPLPRRRAPCFCCILVRSMSSGRIHYNQDFRSNCSLTAQSQHCACLKNRGWFRIKANLVQQVSVQAKMRQDVLLMSTLRQTGVASPSQEMAANECAEGRIDRYCRAIYQQDIDRSIHWAVK
jgi:hypothetical protein